MKFIYRSKLIVFFWLCFFSMHSFALSGNVSDWIPQAIKEGSGLSRDVVATKGSISVVSRIRAISRFVVQKAPTALTLLSLAEIGVKAVDYVMDPDNNRIIVGGQFADMHGKRHPTLKEAIDYNLSACNSYHSTCVYTGLSPSKFGAYSHFTYTDKYSVVQKVKYPITFVDKKEVSFDEVARGVAILAQKGNAAAGQAIKDAIAEAIKQGFHDVDLDKAALTQDQAAVLPDSSSTTSSTLSTNQSTTAKKEEESVEEIVPEEKPNAASGAKPPDFPSFCSWASVVCDFMSPEVPQEEPPKKIPDATLSDVGLDKVNRYEQRVNFNGQCPNKTIQFVVLGHQVREPIPVYHFCLFLSKVAPGFLLLLI